MIARLSIIRGVESGREFAINETMARIGSGPDASIQVAELPEHAITIHQRDQRKTCDQGR